MLKKLWLIHPFLFAIFPVLSLFAYNMDEVSATDLLLPVLAVITGTLILLLSLRLITKNYNKIAIVTTLFLVLFFSYGYVRGLIFSGEGLTSPRINIFFVSLWVVLFITGAFLIIKFGRSFSTFTKFLNVVAIALVAISLINIGIHEIKAPSPVSEETGEEGVILNLNNSDNLRDIYYIIFDRYAREDTLKEFYNYNNNEFIDYLSSKGFCIASRSCSNYPSTYTSMASSLNMDYLTPGVSHAALIEITANSEVSQLLKSVGYRYIYNGIDIKCADKYAEVYSYKDAFGIRVSDFAYSLIETTALSPFARFFGGHGANSILYSFDVLADIPNIKEPTFIYAHILCPHAPYLFDRNGPIKFNVFGSEKSYSEQEKYLEQLIFINKKTKIVVDEILSKSDIAPIIIIQSDTGPGGSEWGNVGTEWRKIFNAYYLPENGNRLLYETITPVNSFRIVFNLYFGTNYDLLEDKIY